MSDVSPQQYSIRIAGESYPWALNMAALDVISEHGYSGEDGEGDFGKAFVDSEGGDNKAQRLIAWAGLLPAYQDATTGEIDFPTAPPQTLTGRMTFGELIDATVIASAAFIASLPAGTLEAVEKEAKRREEAEKSGRPTAPPSKKA